MHISGRDWQDLPKPMNLFTTRNAALLNLNTGEVVRHYSANTKIVVVQKCVTPDKTFFRTESAAAQNLNWAFEASSFGLPNDFAPAEPSDLTPSSKQTLVSARKSPDAGGGEKPRKPFWRRLFQK